MRNPFVVSLILLICACSSDKKTTSSEESSLNLEALPAMLDSIWQMEQTPITLRDSLIRVHGADSEDAAVYQKIYRENHEANLKKVKQILATWSWPKKAVIGEQGNHTICNVLQHADQSTREHYIPQMKQAVLDGELGARWLVRAEDRLATDRGELQIFGGQMKYYPETKSFNLWPVYDPENIDERRAEIGLEPIAEFLKNRFDFDWDLEEQIARSKAFENK